jgi:hypothetical protein
MTEHDGRGMYYGSELARLRSDIPKREGYSKVEDANVMFWNCVD